jgi:predicted nuclease with TOPRIM domain
MSLFDDRDTRSAYVEQMKGKLDQWSAEIERLQASAEETSADVREEYRRRIEELTAMRHSAQAQLDEVRRAGAGAWQDLTAGLDILWEELGSAVRSASKHLHR